MGQASGKLRAPEEEPEVRKFLKFEQVFFWGVSLFCTECGEDLSDLVSHRGGGGNRGLETNVEHRVADVEFCFVIQSVPIKNKHRHVVYSERMRCAKLRCRA